MHVDPAMFERDFEPMGDLVLLRMLKVKESHGGIALPDGASDGQPRRAQVVKVGPGLMNHRANDGSRWLVDERLKPGLVVYPMFAGGGMNVTVGDENYTLVQQSQILGLSGAPPESL
jgi:co-chaperonin GroES (HSP10)